MLKKALKLYRIIIFRNPIFLSSNLGNIIINNLYLYLFECNFLLIILINLNHSIYLMYTISPINQKFQSYLMFLFNFLFIKFLFYSFTTISFNFNLSIINILFIIKDSQIFIYLSIFINLIQMPILIIIPFFFGFFIGFFTGFFIGF